VKLCLVTPGFSAAEDDWCIPALHHLVRRLAREHEVTVIALRHPPRRQPYPFFGARVVPLAGGARTGAWRFMMMLRAVAAVGREHRRSPVDAVHGLWADEAGVVAATAGRRLGIRSVVSVMGGELIGLPDIGYGVQLGRTGRWLVRRSLTGADRVTVGSAALLGPVRALRGDRPAAWAPLGVDPTLFRPDGERAELAGQPCLLHVASLTPVKNQALLLDAFALLGERWAGAHLHVVGDGPLRAPLAERAAALGLADRVRLHGPVAHHRLPPFYRTADLHLVTSRFESQGMAALEAAACGTATVGTAVGILPDMGDGAVTVPDHQAGALAGAVAALLEDGSEAQRLGRHAADLVRRDLSLDSAVARLARLYSSDG
jgi:glycosyltransferase involved in cell wall biosynthesis